jgi:hypothetical protein
MRETTLSYQKVLDASSLIKDICSFEITIRKLIKLLNCDITE